MPFQVAPADLGRVVEGLRAVQSLGGFVVTVPHKSAVVEYCDTVSDAVRQVGAANVVTRSADGRLHGHNLDGQGFVAGLRMGGIEPAGLSVYLAGAGGAACAIAFALAQASVRSLTLYNRTPAKARQLLERLAGAYPALGTGLGTDNPSEHDLVVNATSLGICEGDELPCDVTRLEAGQVVAEIIMEPALTPLLQAAKRQGCQTHPGVSMIWSLLDDIYQRRKLHLQTITDLSMRLDTVTAAPVVAGLREAINRDHLYVLKLRQALNRLSGRKFGWCVTSGDPIGLEHLLRDPTLRYLPKDGDEGAACEEAAR